MTSALPARNLVTERTLAEVSNVMRYKILEAHHRAGGGHLGGCLSIVEILSVIFLRHFSWRSPENPPWQGDRFVLSKGHAVLAYYCLLDQFGLLQPGQLDRIYSNGADLEPHPNERLHPAIHASTGSLGQGLSIGVGLALGSRMRGSPDRTFVLLGDGELNEGQVWEAARCAAVLGLDNLIAVIDMNGLQQDGPMEAIMPVADARAAWQGMGWVGMEADGHDCDALDRTLTSLIQVPEKSPRVLVAHTVKGKGVPFLEGCAESHFPPPLAPEELALLRYLGAGRNADDL